MHLLYTKKTAMIIQSCFYNNDLKFYFFIPPGLQHAGSLSTAEANAFTLSASSPGSERTFLI